MRNVWHSHISLYLSARRGKPNLKACLCMAYSLPFWAVLLIVCCVIGHIFICIQHFQLFFFLHFLLLHFWFNLNWAINSRTFAQIFLFHFNPISDLLLQSPPAQSRLCMYMQLKSRWVVRTVHFCEQKCGATCHTVTSHTFLCVSAVLIYSVISHIGDGIGVVVAVVGVVAFTYTSSGSSYPSLLLSFGLFFRIFHSLFITIYRT